MAGPSEKDRVKSQLEHWTIATFATERGLGTIRSGEVEAPFAVECWVPCDPETARTLQDSEPRRHLLWPRPGEPVAVTWKTNSRGEEVPARIERTEPLANAPALTFFDWLGRMGRRIPMLADWTTDDWRRLATRLDEDISDTVFSKHPEAPTYHLGFFGWIKAHGPREETMGRLDWLHPADGSGRHAMEAIGGSGTLYVGLDDEAVAALVAEGLLIPR